MKFIIIFLSLLSFHTPALRCLRTFSHTQKVYTDEDHELKGVIYHVHKTIESFLDDNFGSLDARENVWEDPVFYIFNKE
jgi:hypothetical protein